MTRHVAIGNYLAALRDQAGLKQNELAKKLEWSPAMLSRVENGERPISDDELAVILDGIGSSNAAKFREVLARGWQLLPEPPLGDLDTDLLWEAEQTAQKIHGLTQQPDIKQVFERRLARYQEELSLAAQRVLNKHYRVAFIGTIAVGKSTAICRAETLELPTSKGMPKAVLETGRGGITICEVHVRRGPSYGLIIEPCPEETLRQHVFDFANVLLNSQQEQIAGDSEEVGSAGISREIDRALRSMAKLKRKRAETKPDGTITPAVDEARALAAVASDAKSLCIELLARMELHKRDRRVIWHSDTVDKPPLEWLQEQFELINNGRHPEFTLPKRIELVIPTEVLGDAALSVTLIDTQGIDDIAARADLEQHFDDAHTVVVLCTRFDEAPQTQVRQLLKRAKEAGVRTLESNALILVLPRPGDALEMKEEGYLAQTIADGYDIKAQEARLKLQQLGLADLAIKFFNAAEDGAETIRQIITERIETVRELHRNSLREIVRGANALLSNYEKEQALEAMRHAARSLTIWLDQKSDLPTTPTRRVHESLLTTVDGAHWKTIYASVNRKGEWPKLDYAHQLSHGARRVAVHLVEPKLRGFKDVADILLHDDELAEARDLVSQAVRVLESGFDSLVRKAQLVGESIHLDDMKLDNEFWDACTRDSGQGYCDRMNARNKGWFEVQHPGYADARVYEAIQEIWKETITSLRQLIAHG